MLRGVYAERVGEGRADKEIAMTRPFEGIG